MLLHGVFKLAKRRKLIASNPSEDAERVSLEDAGSSTSSSRSSSRPSTGRCSASRTSGQKREREPDEIDKLTLAERELYGALLSTAFYAGPRLGELRDLPWRNVDFAGAMICGSSRASREGSGRRRRASALARRRSCRSWRSAWRRWRRASASPATPTTCSPPRAWRARERQHDTPGLLRRARPGRSRHRRDDVDPRGNPQPPIRLHDLRHSWCTWAVNVWPLTKVQAYAGHRGRQDDAALRASPDQGAGRRSRRRVSGCGTRSINAARALTSRIASFSMSRQVGTSARAA